MKPITIAIILILILIIAFTVAASQDKPQFTQRYYVVKAGDTLWSIAKNHCPNNYDIREYIYNVKKINDIENGIINPGQLIRILEVSDYD